MPQNEDADNSVNPEHLAFEYVTGTLRGEERGLFERSLDEDIDLQKAVQFWEEQLMAKHKNTLTREPAKATWSEVEGRINSETQKPINWFTKLIRRCSWQYAGFSLAMVWAISLSLWIGVTGLKTQPSGAPNTDYVAVLIDAKEKPLLTALTSSEGALLWLKWEKAIIEDGTSAQLWAQSRRDGQVRPLYVFESDGLSEIKLDEATLRLVRDSEFLLLTQEEEGGSAIDEPSDILLAKGVCIRLNNLAI